MNYLPRRCAGFHLLAVFSHKMRFIRFLFTSCNLWAEWRRAFLCLFRNRFHWWATVRQTRGKLALDIRRVTNAFPWLFAMSRKPYRPTIWMNNLAKSLVATQFTILRTHQISHPYILRWRRRPWLDWSEWWWCVMGFWRDEQPKNSMEIKINEMTANRSGQFNAIITSEK